MQPFHSFIPLGRDSYNCRYLLDACVDETAYAEQNDSCNAYCEAYTCVYVALYRWNRLTLFGYVHSLDYEKVVVERHYCVYQGDEHKDVEPGTERARKNEEFAEEACKRGNAGKREECKGHYERELGIGLVETVAGAACYGTANLPFDSLDYCKYRHVGNHVDYKIVDKRCCPGSGTCNDGKHDVSCLAYAAECHEALEELLLYCHEVGNGDAGNGGYADYCLPLACNGGEYFGQHCEQCEHGCTL